MIGVDPARFGDDRFSIAWRKGRKVEKIESRSKIDTVAGANWCRTVLDRDKPARMFIDAGGTGAAVYDLLVDWGYGESRGGPVRAVNFGSEPMQPTVFDSEGKAIPGPRNRRAEMWMLSKRLAQRSRRRRYSRPRQPAGRRLRPRLSATIRISGCSSRARNTCARAACARRTNGTRWRSPSPSRCRRTGAVRYQDPRGGHWMSQ